jgi:putative membrane protein
MSETYERTGTDAAAGSPSIELSSRNTGLAFQRTRMSADRTLMSVIRTSLSLISFGFTISQVFQRLYEKNLVTNPNAGQNFGLALVLLGVGMLTLGILYHLEFMFGLRRERREMKLAGLIHAESRFPVSLTLVTAALLLVLGILATASMMLHAGPFY